MAGKVALGLASHWPCILDLSGLSSNGDDESVLHNWLNLFFSQPGDCVNEVTRTVEVNPSPLFLQHYFLCTLMIVGIHGTLALSAKKLQVTTLYLLHPR